MGTCGEWVSSSSVGKGAMCGGGGVGKDFTCGVEKVNEFSGNGRVLTGFRMPGWRYSFGWVAAGVSKRIIVF